MSLKRATGPRGQSESDEVKLAFAECFSAPGVGLSVVSPRGTSFTMLPWKSLCRPGRPGTRDPLISASQVPRLKRCVTAPSQGLRIFAPMNPFLKPGSQVVSMSVITQGSEKLAPGTSSCRQLANPRSKSSLHFDSSVTSTEEKGQLSNPHGDEELDVLSRS